MKSVELREISLSDSSNIVRWRNNPSVKKYLYSQEDITEEDNAKYYKSNVLSGKCKQYIIHVVDSKDIGTIYLRNIDNYSKKAELGIFIGEEQSRGKGYALKAVKQLLNIGFNELGLNRIYLTLMYDNIPAINVYIKAGFSVEGVLKQEYYRNDKYIDVIVMGITKDMWEKDNQ